MSPTEKGKFCSSCQKNVIDFTKSSDREIILAFKKEEKLCGRFRISQLDREMIIPKEKKSIWIVAAASLIAFLGLGNQTAKAQGKIKIEQTENKQINDSKSSNKKLKIYTGIVYDEQNFPLPSVNVNNKRKNSTTYTNFDGTFSIMAKKGDVLTFTFLDYDQVKFKVMDETNIQIILKSNDNSNITDVVVGYPSIIKPAKK
ncbi:carboxypeptidase-like regulatory domain-containing protein [Flavobacterium hibernum]|nr:carboxypeptidase-like regulatory domain-containing protein [Flavobacterium hibernum]